MFFFGFFLGDIGLIVGVILKIVIFYGGYFILIFLSGCIEKEEVENLEKLVEKVGVNLRWFIRVMERFLKDE